ncbi:glycosyltransferase [Emticicia sp. CRIBPO]|uniref:glycosyltransferase family 2 protein n=1 Tax=Emticicia sp. CRIBPO TaxID=2683258 RepID=UPI001412F352|nr:glycosyltransferase [Emticicia sp. CRIBPO]NBA85280.1 glycosyltransferase [Emticicia sp. CRIBPO]
MPKISVVLPVYNSEEFIQEAVTSILDQTYKDFILFAINDGSTDKSHEILSKIKDKRLNVISNEKNMGLIYSLNLGLNLSKDFEYIARMDADDISLSDRFRIQVECLDNNKNVGIVGTSINYFGGGYKPMDVFLPETTGKITPAFLCKNPIVHPTVMLRNSLIQDLGLKYDYDYPKYEDYKLWLDLVNECDFYNIQNILLSYRRHNANVSNQENYQLESDLIMIEKIIISYAEKMNIEFSKEELEVLSIITSVYRWQINKFIPLEILYESINSVVDKHPKNNVDIDYLRHLLWERGLVYLFKCGRKMDILKLISTKNLDVSYIRIFNIHNNWF